jgi:hypothetical protein
LHENIEAQENGEVSAGAESRHVGGCGDGGGEVEWKTRSWGIGVQELHKSLDYASCMHTGLYYYASFLL